MGFNGPTNFNAAGFGVNAGNSEPKKRGDWGLSGRWNPDVADLEAILGHGMVRAAAPALVDVGAKWIVAQLPRVASLLALAPDMARCAAFETRPGVPGLSVFANLEGEGHNIEARSFAPFCGVEEDPVCGSSNGSLAVFRREYRLIASTNVEYTATQGPRLGREGHIAVAVRSDGSVSVSGACVTSIEGHIRLR